MGYKALLVGINAYEGMRLRGCVNDVNRMRELLQQQYNMSDDMLHILLDEAATAAAIQEGLRWLAEPDGTQTPPVRLFHFSGHGTFVADESGDEPDGQDEALVPYDYQTAGMVLDDTLRELYHTFSPNTHLVLTMDCCHSGTVHAAPATLNRFMVVSREEQQRIDAARERFEQKRDAFEAQKRAELSSQQITQEEHNRAIEQLDQKSHFARDPATTTVVILSAAQDQQTAADARLSGDFYGAFSYYLTEALRGSGANLSYPSLMDMVSKSIRDNKFTQIPQLHGSAENIKRAFLGIIPS